MKVKLITLCLCVLSLVSLGFGQNFVACIASIDWQMPTEPGAATFVPDGTPICIYWDANSNGPDPTDALVQVCYNPPDCPDGPPGSFNYDCFPGGFNGESVVGIPGTFVFDPCFTSSGITPNPARYYLKVIPAPCPEGWGGTPGYWQSVIMTFVIGPQEVWLQQSDWEFVPGDCAPLPCCVYTPSVTFPVIGTCPSSQNGTACIMLCHDAPPTMVCVGPLPVPECRPHVTVTGGCPGVDPSEPCSNPASGFDWDAGPHGFGWALIEINSEFYYCQPLSLTPFGTEGIVYLNFDFVEPASMGDVSILPLDNAVRVQFATLAETDLARFEIKRDDHVIARLEAANSPTGHEYTYTDNTALNGTTYTYELVLVNANGTRQVVKTAAVTPSMDKAVVTEYALQQNFPNPFNPTTSIRFDLVEKNFVSLKVYDMTGREVRALVNGERPAGVNVVSFDASRLTSGLYFYTIKIGNVYSSTKKMLLVK